MSRSINQGSGRRRRADAERSVSAIVDAAIEVLAGDLEASMAEIARHAGVVRATVYAHFPTREALIEAITHQGISEVSAVIKASDPDRGEPREALARVISAAWRTLHRYHALVALNARRAEGEVHQEHGPAHAQLRPLIERGQTAGAFRTDVPADWHISMIIALIHAASGELRSERMSAEAIESALVAAVLGAVSGSA